VHWGGERKDEGRHACAEYYVSYGVYALLGEDTRSATETERTVKTTNPWFPLSIIYEPDQNISAQLASQTAVATRID